VITQEVVWPGIVCKRSVPFLGRIQKTFWVPAISGEFKVESCMQFIVTTVTGGLLCVCQKGFSNSVSVFMLI